MYFNSKIKIIYHFTKCSNFAKKLQHGTTGTYCRNEEAKAFDQNFVKCELQGKKEIQPTLLYHIKFDCNMQV